MRNPERRRESTGGVQLLGEVEAAAVMIELLGDPAYRHVLLNHVPVIGLTVAFVVLTIGAVLRQTAILRTGLVLVALTAGVSIPVGIFGDDAYPAILFFLREAKKHIAFVIASVVGVPGLDIEACRHIAEEEIGVGFRVREYNSVG